MLQSYLNVEFIFCNPLVVAVVVTLFFIVNIKTIIVVQVIVSINTIVLSFPVLVGGTVECLFLKSHLECFVEFVAMVLAVLADFSSKCIKSGKPILRPSTWQDIVGTLIANQVVSLWSSLSKPWRLTTTILLALYNNIIMQNKPYNEQYLPEFWQYDLPVFSCLGPSRSHCSW